MARAKNGLSGAVIQRASTVRRSATPAKSAGAAPQRLGGYRLARARVVHLNALLGEDGLGLAGQGLVPDPGEEAGQREVIVLAPAFGGMVMALGALDAHAEEQL